MDHIGVAPDHHAVASFEPPYAPTCANIHIMDSLRSEFLCPPNIVYVIRVSSVDECVSGIETIRELRDSVVDDRCRNHQPDRPWRFQLIDDILEISGSYRVFADKLLNGVSRSIEHHTLVASSQEPQHHVRAHS